MWKKPVLIGWFLFYKYRSMSAADVTKARQQKESIISEIAKNAKDQFGSYKDVINAFKEYNKQLMESNKKSTGGNKATDPMASIKTTMVTQTGILKEILSILKKGITVNGGQPGVALNNLSGQQNEMAKEVKKNNQVKGEIKGTIKIAPESIKEFSIAQTTATTKAMTAVNTKREARQRTQALAQSFTQKKEKQALPKPTVAKSSGGGLFAAIKKAMPQLLLGLKKIFFALLNPVAIVAAFVARFLPYVILGIAFLHGVWKGIGGKIKQISESILGIISELWDKHLKPMLSTAWEGLKTFIGVQWDLWGQKVWDSFVSWLKDTWDKWVVIVNFALDWLGEGLAKLMFDYIYTPISKWMDMASAVIDFCVDWVKDLLKPVTDSISWFVDNTLGIFRDLKNSFANSWLGKKLGLSAEAAPPPTTVNNTNINNNGKNGNNPPSMTKDISAPMLQMTKLMENQNMLLKKMDMTPLEKPANFSAGMTPINGNITVVPADNIKSTLIQQTSTISSIQTNNNREIANAFNSGVDRLVNTMNTNYQRSLVDKQATVSLEG